MNVHARVLLGALAIAAVSGCDGPSDQIPTEPLARSLSAQAPLLSQGVEVTGMRSLRMNLYGRDGKISKRVDVPRWRVRGRVGTRRAIGGAGAAAPNRASFNRAGLGSSQTTRPLPPSTPRMYTNETGEEGTLVTVLDGELTTAYQETFFDSAGVTWMQRTGRSGSGPITTSDLYQNGVIRAMTGYEWTPTSGGYVLTGQVAHLFDEQGNLVAQIYEQTDIEAYAVLTPTTWSRVRSRFASIGQDIVCALAPKTAFAQSIPTACVGRGLLVAANTGTLIVQAASLLYPPTAPVSWTQTGLLAVNWAAFSGNVINFMQCTDAQKRAGAGGGIKKDSASQNPY